MMGSVLAALAREQSNTTWQKQSNTTWQEQPNTTWQDIAHNKPQANTRKQPSCAVTAAKGIRCSPHHSALTTRKKKSGCDSDGDVDDAADDGQLLGSTKEQTRTHTEPLCRQEHNFSAVMTAPIAMSCGSHSLYTEACCSASCSTHHPEEEVWL
jgi:hypothetical protein